ncbi:hypothetical protein H6F90_10770 [Trichocoleus sp. FACHB-591]|uniref:hypothetical protein n=1 Tax=Trichocoleus sp. FACHB-591 TaxID=2692872 RepID=UPI0016838536|nr:hypothetical protein [Trichocoleus sp. FACHB-591]MBD2095637.1 hypothetical protein [Trichocoleus sp. FACHB-591]
MPSKQLTDKPTQKRLASVEGNSTETIEKSVSKNALNIQRRTRRKLQREMLFTIREIRRSVLSGTLNISGKIETNFVSVVLSIIRETRKSLPRKALNTAQGMQKLLDNIEPFVLKIPESKLSG